MKTLLRILVLSSLVCGGISVSNNLIAEAYVPTQPEQIIAQWDIASSEPVRALKTQQNLQLNDPAQVAQLANQYLAQAAQPGQSRLYGITEALLKPFIENNPQDFALQLTWVQVQQHQHRFTIAQNLLQKILLQQPDNVTANLLDARLYLIHDNPASAKAACMRLLGHADLLTLSACTLEARATLGDKELSESYSQLQKIVLTQGLPDDERQVWVIQILADMALRLNAPQAAVDFLNPIRSKNLLSVWVQWADANLALGNYQAVMDELSPLVNTSTQADDSLLIRLAIAEKRIATVSEWKTRVNERITLREQRDDQAHAADLALYYLDVALDPKKALHWAERNWQLAREASDKQLLMRAQQAAGVAIDSKKGDAS